MKLMCQKGRFMKKSFVVIVLSYLLIFLCLFPVCANAYDSSVFIADSFSCGLAWFTDYSEIQESRLPLTGYINKYGDIVITPKYRMAFNFDENGLVDVVSGYTVEISKEEIDVKSFLHKLINTHDETVFPETECYGIKFYPEQGLFVVSYSDDNYNLSYDIYKNPDEKLTDERFESFLISDSGDYPIAVEKDGKWGYIDLNGSYVTELCFDSATSFINGFAIVGEKKDQKNKYHYIDRTGKDIFSYEWDQCSGFVCLPNGEKRALAFIGEIDLVEKHFDDIIYFDKKMAGGNCYVLNDDGGIIFGPFSCVSYDSMSDNGFADFSIDVNGKEKYIILDSQCRFLPGMWDFVDEFDQCGTAIVGVEIPDAVNKTSGAGNLPSDNNKYGLIDCTGNYIFEPIFDDIGLMYDDNNIGTYYACVDGLCGFIKSDGTIICEPVWDDCIWDDYEDLIAVVKDQKWGFVKKDGTIICEPIWDDCSWYAFDGLITVMKDKKWGYMDLAGNVVIDLEWDKAGYFSDEAAIVWKDEMFYIIDTQGNILY